MHHSDFNCYFHNRGHCLIGHLNALNSQTGLESQICSAPLFCSDLQSWFWKYIFYFFCPGKKKAALQKEQDKAIMSRHWLCDCIVSLVDSCGSYALASGR